ncbi:MAG: alkaline shock response membrane anchor protein AmaP [Lentisphaerae bacterium]|nr:alkaline shock response membrane anchor protein AmaP [Lentisphaerota bacterium]
MRILNRIVQLLVLLVAAVIGLLMMVVPLKTRTFYLFLDILADSRVIAVYAGLAVFCLALLFALTGLTRRRREKFLCFDNESGKVSISTEAISDYISKLAPEFPSVSRMRTRVIPARKEIDVVVDVRVRAGSQVHEMCELLQQRVRESMINSLGISAIRNVEISVREITSEHRPI